MEPKRLTDAAVKYLMSHDFPGNVRQLENLCHWLTVMAPGSNVDIHDLPPEFRQDQRALTTESWIVGLGARGGAGAQPRRAEHHARDDAVSSNGRSS